MAIMFGRTSSPPWTHRTYDDHCALLARIGAPTRTRTRNLNQGGQFTASPGFTTRVEWLDGVRALAASFVVLHHVWLMSFNGFPDNNGPWLTGWLAYGHLAVAVFIVISGFSLTLSPSRHGYSLSEGGWGFLRRRFWRIVPPYWAALVISAALIWVGLTFPPTGGGYGLETL